MKRLQFKAWIVVHPEKGMMFYNTIQLTREHSQMFYLADRRGRFPTWTHAYRKGYRCVRCTVTADEPDRKIR